MPQPAPMLIAEVERATGIARATLRVWEQRYGFPRPGRNASGERTYSAEQVQRLRTIQQLVRAGHRPGSIVSLGTPALQKLAKAASHRVASSIPDDPLLKVLREHDAEALIRNLRRSVTELGLERFVLQLGALNRTVGNAWECGQLQVFEEHAYVEAVQSVLRQCLLDLPAPAGQGRPSVLLTTLPGEPHGLGLLMAQAVFALQGCKCVSLGVQVPVGQVVAAAAAYRCDAVALSFSAAAQSRNVLAALQLMRSQLPESTQIWVGGSSPAIQRRDIEGVRTLLGIEEVRLAVEQFRAG